MGNRKLTDEQIAQAREMRESGVSYHAIGVVMNVSGNTIKYNVHPEEREQHREGTKIHYKTHRQQVLARVAKYNNEHKEEKRIYDIEYCANNKEYIRLRKAQYQKSHREQLKAHKAAYYAMHKGEARAYAKEHQAGRTANQMLRKALITGATIGNLAEIREIYRRAKEDPKVRCYLCGDLIPIGHRHVDHIYPVSKGGAHRPSNLAVACDHCNESKGAKLPEEVGVLL